MPYTTYAETFAIWNGPLPRGDTQRFHLLYGQIADATSTTEPFSTSSLVGKLPAISMLSEKTQLEVIRVVLRDAAKLPAPAHRIIPTAMNKRLYQWDFSQDPDLARSL